MSTRTRWMVVALALAGATCLALAVLSPSIGPWWSSDAVQIGPTGSSRCFGDAGCERFDHGWIGGSELWRRTGVATSAAGAITAFALIALAASLASRRRGRLVAGAVLTGTLSAAIAGAIFVATFPGVEGAGAARGLLFYGVGLVVAGATAGIVLRGAPRAIAAPG